jgi:hypothetical protein
MSHISINHLLCKIRCREIYSYGIISSQAKLKKKEVSDLHKEMDTGKISKLRSLYGEVLQHSLENMKIDSKDVYVLWIEEDYC